MWGEGNSNYRYTDARERDRHGREGAPICPKKTIKRRP